jgi:hypothetical protein
MSKRTAKVFSIVCVVAAVASFALGMSFYYLDLPTTPDPDLERTYQLNNHGYITFMTHRQYLVHEICIDVFMLPFVIAVLIDYFHDPFDRGYR